MAKLSFFQKFFYGLGGGVNAVKTDFFVFYLGFFYLTVVGLSPIYTGLALFLALVLDAFTDPLIGSISDRLKTKYGRRHYLMMISLLPILVSYLMLFFPINAWVDNEILIFLWLLFFSSLTRFCVTLFDIPHRALAIELPNSYEEKSDIMSLREGFQAIIALSHSFLILPMMSPLLRSNNDPLEWLNIGIIGSIMMLLMGLFSILGTLKIIPNLKTVAEENKFQFKKLNQIFLDLKKVLANKSLLIFLVGSILIQAGWGLANSLTFLTQIEFWELTPNQIQRFIFIYFLAALAGWYLTPRIIRKIEKHVLVVVSLFVIGLFLSLPYVGYLFNLAPVKGSDYLIIYIGVCVFFTSTFSYVSLMARESMVPDIVDQISQNTDVRNDGSVSAVTSFCAKCMSGLGQFISMFILWLIAFPSGNSGEPTTFQLEQLAFFQGPFIFLLFLVPSLIFLRYPLTRAIHRNIKT